MNNFFYTPEGEIIALILVIWSLFWKGLSLWRAAHFEQKYWFIALIIVTNTLGILDIIYLFNFAKNKLTIQEVRHYFTKENLEQFKFKKNRSK